jgi:hypothetical protein
VQDELQKLKPSPRSSRSLGSDTGDLDELAITPLPPRAQLTRPDFYFQALTAPRLTNKSNRSTGDQVT